MSTPPRLPSRIPVLSLMLLLWFPGPLPAPRAQAAAALRDRQGMLRIEGRPRFVLGLYENPADDRELAEAVRSGFNLFQCPPDRAALDRIRNAGALAWVNLGGSLDLSSQTAERAAQLRKLVAQVGDHPALLLWEGPDEILWNQWWSPMETLRAELRSMRTLAATNAGVAPLAGRVQDLFDRGLHGEFQAAREEFWRRAGVPCPHPGVRVDDAPERVRLVGDGVTAGMRLVRQLDPRHAIWMNHAPRNSLADLRRFNAAADVAGCDIYPVPANLDVMHSDLPDLGLSSVGAYTRRMREAAPGRSCAMVLQGFGWRDLREKLTDHQWALGIGRPPTFRESRFMAYDAILNGANAILYWGTAYTKPWSPDGVPGKGRPPLWSDLLRLARELRALEPALVAVPERRIRVTPAETFGSHEVPALRASLRRVGDDEVILVANESGHGLRFTVDQLPARLRGRTLYRLPGGEEHRLEDGRFTDGLRGWDVHVYATSRRFEPPDGAR